MPHYEVVAADIPVMKAVADW